MNSKVGQEILENVKDVVAEGMRKDIEESVQEAGEVDGRKVQLESYGKPKIVNTTIQVPVVVATILEQYDLEQMAQKVDQAWLDRQKNALLQMLVLRQNPTDPYTGRRRGAQMYFDTEKFELEYLEGNVIRLTTTVICDLEPLLNTLSGLRWDMSNCIRDLAGRKRGPAGKLA